MGRGLQDITVPNVALPTGKVKLPEWELVTRDDFRYYAFTRVRINGYAGTLYSTDSITDAIRALHAMHNNVLILAGHAQYAPETKRGYVFLSDRRMG